MGPEGQGSLLSIFPCPKKEWRHVSILGFEMAESVPDKKNNSKWRSIMAALEEGFP